MEKETRLPLKGAVALGARTMVLLPLATRSTFVGVLSISRTKPRPFGVPDAAERQQIEDALRVSQGRVSGVGGAAQALGVAPSTLESRIQRLGVDKLAFRRRPNS